jgi:hypothetical protein
MAMQAITVLVRSIFNPLSLDENNLIPEKVVHHNLESKSTAIVRNDICSRKFGKYLGPSPDFGWIQFCSGRV